jgi:geranylgeranyl diphosphate synthase type II
MKDFSELQSLINDEIHKIDFPSYPSNLYDPIKYILNLRAKRMRSIALLTSFQIYNSDLKVATEAALAIEVFHNFTLIHDDIMDNASLRRGSQTVHEKWDRNIAILSGDTMLVKSYSLLLGLDLSIQRDVLDVFSKTAKQVCEGQQLDIDFEKMNNLSIDQYLDMIKLKTSVLLAASFQIGALIGGASKPDALFLYNYGLNLGIAFQLQDDLLDLYGDKNKFGKNIGGDIISNKKTFLYLKSLSIANDNQRNNLLTHYLNNELSTNEKVESVKSIFDELNIYDITKDFISSYHHKAISCLNSVTVSNHNSLNYFADLLLQREV